jgi:putative membrane-bound dehydrogenase-like protein
VTKTSILLLFVAVSLSLGGATLLAEDSFPEIYDVEAPAAQPTKPADALASMVLPEGFHATLFAAEPNIRQPISLTFDERGRLWVVECYTYAEGKRNFDTKLRDRVVILEDTNADGVHDKRTVFWDQGVKLTSVEIGLDGVWLLAPPNVLFLADKNRDDVPDGPPQIILDGFKETMIRHNIPNGLKWGPDGWLYGRQGILETSLVGKPTASPSQRTPVNCGVWRYHPLRQQFETVLHGTTNPWGFDYDQNGEMFIINTVIGHLWHVVPGSHTERMYGADANPFVYGLIGQVADHVHWDAGEPWFAIRKGSSDTTKALGGGHAHSGLMIYQGDNWPAEDRGRAFGINFHGRRLNRDRMERQGSGYTARHEPDRIYWNDTWFRGIDLIWGPDGGVFVIDWSDTGECHEEDGIHRSSGRIYKIVYRSPQAVASFDLRTESLQALTELASRPNKWWPRQARRVLRDRQQSGESMDRVVPLLQHILSESQDRSARLEALWMLEAISAVDPSLIKQLFSDDDEYLRAWGVRLLADRCQTDSTSSESVQLLESCAVAESSMLVQLYLASALQKLPIDSRWTLASTLAAKKNAVTDRTLGLMCWYGIEPALLTDRKKGIELYQSAQHSTVRRFIARRMAEEIERDPQRIDDLLLSATDPSDVIAGMGEAFRGWSKATPPTNYAVAIKRLSSAQKEQLASTLREIGIVFGDGRSTQELLQLLSSQDLDARRRAVRTLSRMPSPEVFSAILPLASDRELQVDAIRALAAFDDPSLSARLLPLWSTMSPAAREATIDTLTSRASSALALLQSIEQKVIPATALTAFHARQLRSFENDAVSTLLRQVWGEARESAGQKADLISKYKSQLMTDENIARGNLSRGRQLFEKQCAGCHILFGSGRKVGPDLTGSQRKNGDYLLENLIDPSALVAADFRAVTTVLSDGRSIQGVIASQGERTITLQTKDQDLLLDRRDIEEIKQTSVSLMPEGILESLSPDEARDLISYLMADHQVPLPP